MRTVTEQIYKFDELPADVQHRVVEAWESDFVGHYDFEATLTALEQFLGCRVSRWSYDVCHYNYDLYVDDSLSDRPAYRVVDALLDDVAFRRLYYNPAFTAKRRSRIQIDVDSYPFTGYCYDFAFTDALHALRARPDFLTVRYADFCKSVFNALFGLVVEDFRYHNSVTGKVEAIRAADIEFRAGGSVYV